MTTLLLQNDSVRVAQLSVIKAFGDSRAIFLQQIHHWLENKKTAGANHNGKHWVYNTYEEWAKQTAKNPRTIKRYVNYFKEKGVIEAKSLCKNKFIHVNYYTINYDRLDEILGERYDRLEDNTSNFNKDRTRCHYRQGPAVTNKIQREHTKINNNSSEGKPSKNLVNFCDNFKNLYGNVLQEGIIDQKPLSIPENAPEKVIQTTNSKNSQQEIIRLEIQQQLQDIQSNSSQKPSKLNNQEIFQNHLKSKENQPFPPLSKDKNTLEKASVVLTQLLEIYNQEVGYYVGNVTLNKDRARFLMAGYIKKFDKNLDKWRLFCKSIVSSDHLLGKINKAFKLSFDWVLKFTTIDKFLKGDYGIRKTLNQLEAEKAAQRKKSRPKMRPLKTSKLMKISQNLELKF